MTFKRISIVVLIVAGLTLIPAGSVASLEPDRFVKTYRQALAAEQCILYRESRNGNTRPNSVGASGYYQFMRGSWTVTVQRMGKDEWAGRDASSFTRKQQRSVYLAAWSHGNGRFYWSSRWSAFACFKNDTKPVPKMFR